MQTAPINKEMSQSKFHTVSHEQHGTTSVHFQFSIQTRHVRCKKLLKAKKQRSKWLYLHPQGALWEKRAGIEKITNETFTARLAAKSSWYRIRSSFLLNTGYSIIIHD